eukprot:7727870-Pyramimonas_sp.AAC.1
MATTEWSGAAGRQADDARRGEGPPPAHPLWCPEIATPAVHRRLGTYRHRGERPPPAHPLWCGESVTPATLSDPST